MSGLVLSLFPGIGLLDKAFEEEGFCVVRGPDILWGGDIHTFHPTPGVFDGVIGGPPCQKHSTASAIAGTTKVDLIPEFLRVVDECDDGKKKPWVVMENVLATLQHPLIPRAWHPVKLRDWDCGGETSRRRVFYCWPFMVMEPQKREGQPSLSVLASTAKKGTSQYAADKRFLRGNLPMEEYERLQGAPGITRGMMDAGSSKYFAVHCLGNGVPLAMGRVVARAVRAALEQRAGAA